MELLQVSLNLELEERKKNYIENVARDDAEINFLIN
jgi:hypothetical protein